MSEADDNGAGLSEESQSNINSSEHESNPPTYLEVENGLFKLQSIAGEDFSLLPKGMNKPTADGGMSAVYRADLVHAVIEGLKEGMKDRTRPGVYVQGPEGVGKSMLLYTVAQVAKFKLNWICVYIPNCRYWANLGKVEAQGFFLDRVAEAISESSRSSFEGTKAMLNNVPADASLTDDGIVMDGTKKFSWQDAAEFDTNSSQVGKVYAAVIKTFKDQTQRPLLLVFDEVNALWPENEKSLVGSYPWKNVDFGTPFLENGNLLVSGTTDCEFVDCIPSGANEIVVSVDPLEKPERNALLRTSAFRKLQELKDFDEGLWQTVVDAAGNIPRELRKLCDFIGKEDKRKKTKSDDDISEEPPNKKQRLLQVIQKARLHSQSEHSRKVDKAITKDVSGVFQRRLCEACRTIFIYGLPATINRTALHVPNWVISKDGSHMHPTTFDVQAVYFEWFRLSCECSDEDRSLLDALATISESFTGGERGNAFEKLLTKKLTMMQGGCKLKYRPLRYSLFNHFCPDLMEISLLVRHRLFKYSTDPPDNFHIFPEDTLCTHVDPDGGEERVDLIHYRHDRVVYIEATVSDYRDKKIPQLEGSEREDAIVKSIQKWLGDDTFSVTLQPAGTSYLGLTPAPKKLVAEYKRSRSNRQRPQPPELMYIVATTCPRSVKLSPQRTKKASWINTCFLEDLVASGIIDAAYQQCIMKAQAKNAGRPS